MWDGMNERDYIILLLLPLANLGQQERKQTIFRAFQSWG
jgi:hypothetical protein